MLLCLTAGCTPQALTAMRENPNTDRRDERKRATPTAKKGELCINRSQCAPCCRWSVLVKYMPGYSRSVGVVDATQPYAMTVWLFCGAAWVNRSVTLFN